MAIPNSYIYLNPKLFLNEMNGLAKGSSIVIVIEDLVTEDPLNMRNRSSIFRYKGFAYLADKSTMVRYNGGKGEIARYTGNGDRIWGVGGGGSEYADRYVDGHVSEHGGEDWGEGEDEDLDKDPRYLYVCF